MSSSDRPDTSRALTTDVSTPSAQRRRERVVVSKERLSVLPPFDPSRLPARTRDLVDVQTRLEGDLPLTSFSEYGQATSHGVRSLICELTSPIAVGSEPRYQLGPRGAERSSADCLYAYRWTVRRRADGRPIWQT